MQRRKGQFVGKANPQEGALASTSGDPDQNLNQDETRQDNKSVLSLFLLSWHLYMIIQKIMLLHAYI